MTYNLQSLSENDIPTLYQTFMEAFSDYIQNVSHVTEPKHDEMKKLFSNYRDWIVDEELMNIAKPNSGYMHCMPCERGFEVTDNVLDGKWGITTFEEAENCLHAQKGVMASIIQ